MAHTLLVADNSLMIQRVVDLTFAAQGVRVVGVSDGLRAIEHLTDSRPDAAMLSVSLPGKEGTIRGYQGVHLLIIDEAAKVADDLYASTSPMTAIVDAYRRVILYGTAPPASFGWVAALGLLLLPLVWLAFHRSEFRFAERI